MKNVSPAVLQSELDLMNRLLLTFIDVEDLVKAVTDNMYKETENEPYKFVGFDEETVCITEDDVDRHIEHAFQEIYDWADNIPTVVYKVVHEKLEKDFIENLQAELQEEINDQREFERDPLGYYGMSQRDFI